MQNSARPVRHWEFAINCENEAAIGDSRYARSAGVVMDRFCYTSGALQAWLRHRARLEAATVAPREGVPVYL